MDFRGAASEGEPEQDQGAQKVCWRESSNGQFHVLSSQVLRWAGVRARELGEKPGGGNKKTDEIR